ncbi:hypothetical protein MPER_08169 [Moniliophthora perniciosa FA553]|nr:hypothetical protein MPER_08169 [Moniliophthora perniciosa FA553]
MSGVALSPLPTTVSTLLATAVGTALCSASANTFNQLQGVHAAGFGIVTGIAGPVILWTLGQPDDSHSGPVEYCSLCWRVYVDETKELFQHMACGGQLLPSESYPVHLFPPTFFSSLPVDLAMIDNPLAPFALFMLLFSWQFPHFNPLAHLVRGSYAQAGYSMLSVLDPKKNALVALRHALLLVPICSVLMPLSGLTTWWFAITSVFPNLISVHASWEFWKKGGEKEARVLFRHSLWYLPVMLGLMMIHKQGVDWMQWIGFREEDEEKDVAESKS